MSAETTETAETPEAAIPETPEDAAEAPAGPTPVGTLSEEELALLASLQQGNHQTIMRIGQLEVEKAAMIQALSAAESRAQGVMNKAAERFEVAPNQRWTITPDGKVFVAGG